MFKYLLAPACLLIIGLFAVAAPTDPGAVPERKNVEVGDLSGVYFCEGNEQGKSYSAVVMVLKVSDGIYIVQHSMGPNLNSPSVWMRDGNYVAVSYGKGGQGVGRYKIEEKTLRGEFVALPELTRATEVLTYKMALPKTKAVQ